jgi:cobalt-zinc-cadmium efflux system protein
LHHIDTTAGSHTHEAKSQSLVVALVANAGLLVAELVGGLVFGSLTLLADAAHLVSDVIALSIALVAVIIARRPATDRHTYGFARAEVLAAQANGVLLLAGAGAVAFEAFRRFDQPHHLDATGVVVLGAVGLAVNLGSALLVGRHSHDDLNLRGAWWHLISDAIGSVLVIVVGVSALAWDTKRLDAIASLAIAALVVAAAWRLLRDATRVLLEAVPSAIDLPAVRAALASYSGVEAVHHLHVWSLGTSHPALSAHVVLSGPLSLHDAQEHSGALKAMLAERFDIEHATIEVECHACVDDDAHAT